MRLRILEFSAGRCPFSKSIRSLFLPVVDINGYAVVVHGDMLDAKADLEQDLRSFYQYVAQAEFYRILRIDYHRFERRARSSNALTKEHLTLVSEKANEICAALSLDSGILLSTQSINGNISDVSESSLAKLHYVLKQAFVKYDRYEASMRSVTLTDKPIPCTEAVQSGRSFYRRLLNWKQK